MATCQMKRTRAAAAAADEDEGDTGTGVYSSRREKEQIIIQVGFT